MVGGYVSECREAGRRVCPQARVVVPEADAEALEFCCCCFRCAWHFALRSFGYPCRIASRMTIAWVGAIRSDYLSALFVSESYQRVHVDGATGWDVAGEERNACEAESDENISERVAGFYAEQECGDEAGDDQRESAAYQH